MDYVISVGNHEAVSVLLDAGYDPSTYDNVAIIQTFLPDYKNELIRYKLIKILLQDPRTNPATDNNFPIREASLMGYTEIVKLLLSDTRVDPSAQNNYLIRHAVEEGHDDIVELLLKNPKVDPSAKNNYSIISAASAGRTKIVKLLLKDPRVNPSINNNEPIIKAASNGRMVVVKLLLQDLRVNPAAQNNLAMAVAISGNHRAVANVLIDDNRVDPLGNYEKNPKNIHADLHKDWFIELLKYKISDRLSGYATVKIGKNQKMTDWGKLGLYRQLLHYIIRTQSSLIQIINKLKQYVIIRDNLRNREIIEYAALSTLKNTVLLKKYWTKEDLDFYFIFKGFLLLSFEPQYTKKEILDIIKKQGATDKAIIYTNKLISSYLGLNQLKKQGLVITIQMNNDVKHINNKKDIIWLITSYRI
jgi:hypothetical protein